MKHGKSSFLPLLTLALATVASAAACGPSEEHPADASFDKATGELPTELVVAEFDVDGMTCGGCALAAKFALRKLDGVVAADASFDEATGEGRCTVRYDPGLVSPEQMVIAITDVGFTATPREPAAGKS
jgi:copper chaperone CopZ